MPLLGSGVIPSGAVGNELTAVTRRAFIPKLIVQIYKASPLLAAGLANAQMASGGVSSVTVPVQGTAFVTAAMSDYGGSFAQPAVTQGAYEADFNLKLAITPIPFLGMEGAVQVNAGVIQLIEARLNDAGNSTADLFATQLWAAATASALNIWALADAALASNPAIGNYGNLSATTNTWWVGNAITDSGSITRQKMLRAIASAAYANGGEMPTFGVTDLATWVALAQDFQGQEQYHTTPGDGGYDQAAGGIRSAFTALVVAGVPIYADPYATNGAGVVYFINDRYWQFFIHEDAAFTFTGFASTLPNFQLGYVGALVSILDNILVKRKAITRCSGFTISVTL